MQQRLGQLQLDCNQVQGRGAQQTKREISNEMHPSAFEYRVSAAGHSSGMTIIPVYAVKTHYFSCNLDAH
eukprot:4914440-Amphidinium_carterae.1